MKPVIFVAALCGASAAQVTRAPTLASGGNASTSVNIAEAKYPCVYPDKRVTFAPRLLK